MPDATTEPRGDGDGSLTVMWAVVPVSIALAGLIAVAFAATRGFDLSDEGSYWWASANPERLENSVTQYPRLTAWLYAAMGWNIALVRLARLVLVVAGAAFLASTVVRWLAATGVAVSRTAAVSLAALVIVAPLGSSIWLPQTFAYNDLVLVEMLFVCGSVARAAMSTDRRRAVMWALAAGLVVWGVAMTKFSSAGAIALMGVGLVVAAPNPAATRRDRAGVLAAQVGGVALGALLWHVLVAGLGDTLAGVRIGYDDASSSHGSESLLDTYRLDLQTLRTLGLLTIGSVLLRKWVRSWLALTLWGVAVILVVLDVPPDRPIALFERPFDRSLLGPLLAAGALVWRGPSISAFTPPWKSDHLRRVALFVVLAAIPPLAAMGTANSLLVGAINLAPFWTLAGFVALAGSTASRVRSVAVFCSVAAFSYAWLGGTGTWIDPYRQVPLADATATVEGVAAFDGVRLAPALAESIIRADGIVSAYVGDDHHWMLPFWRLPGLAYATGSDTPEFVWAPGAVERNLRAIEAACTDGDPLVVVTTEELEPHYVDALSDACGVPFPRRWDQLGTLDLESVPIRMYGIRGNR